jgi:carboxymethylenebutenolidase
MQAYVAVPDGDGPFPAVVVAQHQSGVDAFIRSACDRLAEAGYAAAAPDQYHRSEQEVGFDELTSLKRDDPRRDGIVLPMAEKLLDVEIVHDLSAALDHLASLPQVGGSMGVTGFCMGGRAAYLLATRNASLKAAACFYPGNAFKPRGGGPSPFAATDRIVAPMYIFHGLDDQNPSPDDVARMDAELTRLNKEHAIQAYEGAAHAFMDPSNVKGYREQAAVDAWPKLIAFFDEKLKAVVAAG